MTGIKDTRKRIITVNKYIRENFNIDDIKKKIRKGEIKI